MYLEKLKKLLDNSYCVYSGFAVSSIVVMKDGKEFEGVNVEDASTRAGICAERNAITTAITNGYTKGDFKEIHVLTSSKDIGTCCFVCRQLILEFFEEDTYVYCYSKTGKMRHFTVKELCPYPFGSEDLKQ